MFKDETGKVVSIGQINEVHKRAQRRFYAGLALIIATAAAIVVGLVWFFVYLKCHCWFGWFGTGPIEVLDRYYYYEANGEEQFYVDQGEERHVANENIVLVVKLSLRKECHCSDILGEAHNYKKGETGKWVETSLGGGELSPRNGDVTTLAGEWIRPPPGERYRIEIRLKCQSRPDENIAILNYATFNLEEEK